MAASVAALLFACVGMVGLALVSGRLPGDVLGRHIVHAASCSGSAVSNPSSGPVGAVIAVCGSGWSSVADGTPVSFGYSTDPNCASNNTIVENSQQGTMQGGSYSGWFRWPLNTSQSTYTVCAFIANIAAPPANTYTVLSTSPPRVTIAPTQIHPGQSVTVTGSNYLPGGTFVLLTFQPTNGGSVQSLGSTISNSNGSFSISKNIPANSLGSDMIVANTGSGQQPTLSASVTFTVSSAPVPTPRPTAMPTALVAITPTPLPTATATGIAKTPTSVIGPTPVAAQNTGPGQTPTAANPPITTQNNSGTSAGNGQSGQNTFSPLPFALGAVILLFLLTVLLNGVRARKKRRRAAELEKELAPNNGPPWVGGNGLIDSYMNNSMNLAPVPPMPGVGVGPTAVMGNSAGQGQSAPWAQSQQSAPTNGANGRPMQAAAGVPVGISAGQDALLEAKMRQAQMGLYAFARARAGSAEESQS